MKLNYAVIPLIVLATAVIGGMITSRGMAWYKTIKKPLWTPPGAVIGVVWTFIFILSTLSALIVWNFIPHGTRFWVIIVLFLLNALANIFWTYLFFGTHHMYAAIWEALFLEVTVLCLIELTKAVSAGAAFLLLPYAAWVLFASYLTYRVWALNK